MVMQNLTYEKYVSYQAVFISSMYSEPCWVPFDYSTVPNAYHVISLPQSTHPTPRQYRYVASQCHPSHLRGIKFMTQNPVYKSPHSISSNKRNRPPQKRISAAITYLPTPTMNSYSFLFPNPHPFLAPPPPSLPLPPLRAASLTFPFPTTLFLCFPSKPPFSFLPPAAAENMRLYLLPSPAPSVAGVIASWLSLASIDVGEDGMA